MLPLLVTAGQGLAWLAVTLGQLVLWGAGIGFGFWVVKKLTFAIDVKLAKRFGKQLIPEQALI